MARICIDLDGVIAGFKQKGEGYADVAPIPGAIEKLKKWKAQGHYIIIQTARHMKTCESNLGLVNARVTEDTLAWLRRHGICYDEIYFGKPWAQIYIDDNGCRFHDWKDLPDEAGDLPQHNEERVKN